MAHLSSARTLRRWLTPAAPLAALALLAACGGGGTASGGGTAAYAPTAAELEAELAAQRPLESDDRLVRVHLAERTALRLLGAWTGLEADLGGPAQAGAALDQAAAGLAAATVGDAAYRARLDALLARSAAGVRAPSAMAGVLAQAAGDGQLANGVLGLGLGFFDVGVGSRKLSGRAFEGRLADHGGSSSGGTTSTFEFDAIRDHLSYASSMDVDDAAAGLHLQSRSRLESQLCPDAGGRLTLGYHVESGVHRLGDATTGVNVAIDLTLTRQLDDDANLVGDFAYDLRLQLAGFEGGAGSYLDLTVTQPPGERASSTFSRSAGAIGPAHAAAVKALVLVALAQGLWLSEDMERGAQSGRCIDLGVTTDPVGRTGLAPSSTVTLVASPRSAVDGTMAAGKVTATLTGGQSITPAVATADATFTYQAPAGPGQAAAVALESRSRRGVGKASVDFATGAVVRQYRGALAAQGGIAGGPVTRIEMGDVTWTLREGSAGEALVYVPSGNATVTFSVAGCSLTRVLPVDAASSFLQVYGEAERADGRQRGYFAQLNTIRVAARLTCLALPVGLDVELQGVFRNGCDSTVTPDPGMPRYTDVKDLSGTRQVGLPCNTVTVEPHSWSFRAVP